jgi:hypothetical protein
MSREKLGLIDFDRAYFAGVANTRLPRERLRFAEKIIEKIIQEEAGQAAGVVADYGVFVEEIVLDYPEA